MNFNSVDKKSSPAKVCSNLKNHLYANQKTWKVLEFYNCGISQPGMSWEKEWYLKLKYQKSQKFLFYDKQPGVLGMLEMGGLLWILES